MIITMAIQPPAIRAEINAFVPAMIALTAASKIELTAYDDLFETDESRAEANLSKIREIPIAEIDEFPDHPFKVLMDEDMEQLVDSVRRSGVMTPATVRQKEDGRYELISGHRRKKACELAGLETLKCEVIPCVLSEIRSPARGTEFPDGDGAFKGGRGKGGRRRLCKPA